MLKNRIIKAATFEGATPKGVIGDELIAFHRRVAAGGAAMTTVAYLAVSPEGRTDRHCALLGDESLPVLRRLTDAVHDSGAAVSAQIGHAGPVANGRSNRSASLAPSRRLSPSGALTREASEGDITRITEDYRLGAELAVQAGFDCLEIHLGHNYLLSAFLSPKLNRRTDRWGGSLANRARFPRQVVNAVREVVGDRAAVTAKLNMADGVTGGFWLDESIEFARMLESDGALDAIELTGGSSLSNPMYLFRGEAPVREFGATLPGPLRLGFKAVGSRFLKEYPFEEAFFLPYARQFLDALSTPLILLGGVNRLETVERALSEGFAFVAMARALLREPDLIERWEEGARDDGLCIHCNKCVPTIYSGTRCVLVPDAAPLGQVAVEEA
jgi:2,4-dienoyl-CoA reductase-like NADH-dependent reductase (Old Yellow Enzyme family)